MVLAIGLVQMVEYAVDIGLSIGQTLPSIQPTLSLGRSSPLTALSLTCLGAALLLSDVRTTARVTPSQWLVVCAALAGFAGLTAILLGPSPLYRMVGLSLPTAVGVLVTSMGLLLARPAAGMMRVVTSPGPGGILLRRLALPAVVAQLVLGVVVIRVSAVLDIADVSIPVAIMVAAMVALSLFLLVVTAAPLDRAHEDSDASRALAQSLVEQAPDGIFVANLDGRYTEANEAGCRMLQYSRQEIIGKTIFDLLPPEDFERLLQSKKLLLRGDSDVGEWRLRRKDGSYLPAEVSARILPDGRWQGFVRDISDRKRLEGELRLSEAKHRFLAEVGPVLATTLDYEETLSRITEMATQGLADFCVVDLVDEKGEVRRVRIVSRDPAKVWICEALQRIPFDQGPPPLDRLVLDSAEPFLLPRLTPEDVDRLAATDAHRPLLIAAELQSLMVIPLIAAGKRLGAISFLSATPSHLYGPDDLRMASELAQRAALAVDSARLYRAAQRAIQLRDEVLGVVAHDLRNPLSLILMEARILGSNWQGPERRKRAPAEVIEDAASRMNRLIQDLLDVTSIEAGQLTVERVRLSVAEIVSDTVDGHRALASSRSMDLRLDMAQEVLEIWADRDRLLQVFDNLIGNAVKFTAPGESITVGAARRDTDALFWIRDTGSGIAIDDQPHVFDRFWQARLTRRTGAGLGLAIVRGIVEAHGGRVWVESTPGRGSTFFFTVPTAPTIQVAVAS